MKQLMIILSFGLIFFITSTQDAFCQKLTQIEKDSIENQIRNQFNNAVDAAISNVGFEDYFAVRVSGISNEVEIGTRAEVIDIAKPAFIYYKDNTIQVVENIISNQSFYFAEQSIKIITIHTDTSRGIAIRTTNKVDKHMTLGLKWGRSDGEPWRIIYLNRDLWRYR